MPTDSIYRDLYSRRYSQEIQRAAWYKRKFVRRGIKIGVIALIILFLIVAALSTWALSLPTSSIGEMGVHLIGYVGLKTCRSVGFAGAVALSLFLIIYLHKSTFMLSHYISEDRGFLYDIKDSMGVIKAYLYGTIHKLPKGDKGLNEEVCKRVRRCRAVFIECNIPEEKGLRRLLRIVMDGYLGIQPGVDQKLMDYAQNKGISVVGFETMDEHEVMLSHFVRVLTRNPIKSRNLVRRLTTKEALDRILVSWKTGSEEDVSLLIDEMVNVENLKDWTDLKDILKELSDDRNVKWMQQLSKELQELLEDPIFIAVGSMHLFDFPTIETIGLITRLKEGGWSVKRV